jgi:hypothetical protein
VIWKIPLEQHSSNARHDGLSIPSAEQTQILTLFDSVHYTIEEVESQPAADFPPERHSMPVAMATVETQQAASVRA